MAESSLKLVPSEQRELDEELHAIPAKQIRCRQGHHHFPLDDWIPGEQLPRGITVMHAKDGRYKLLEPCLACGVVTRQTQTHPGGRLDGDCERTLLYGKEWHRMPTYLPRGRRTMRGEAFRRGERQLRDLLGRVITLDEDLAEPPPRPVAAVKFQGA